jgi:hypothetical protein
LIIGRGGRSQKPEGPTIDCQKPEGDKLHRRVFFWLLASGFYARL